MTGADRVLARVRRFLQAGEPGQIILNVDQGGRVISVEVRETVRLRPGEPSSEILDRVLGVRVES